MATILRNNLLPRELDFTRAPSFTSMNSHRRHEAKPMLFFLWVLSWICWCGTSACKAYWKKHAQFGYLSYWTSIFEWCVVRCGHEHNHQTYTMAQTRLKYVLQFHSPIQYLLIHIIHFDTFRFDNEWIIHMSSKHDE